MSSKNFFSSGLKLGILGGGQLGKMLLEVANRYDFHVKILDPSADAPCRYLCKEFVQGSLNDFDTVMKFAGDCDVVTIEIENVNTDALHRLEEKGKLVYPRPATLEIIKNKSRQKDFYRTHKIPTASFFTFKNRQEMLEGLSQTSFSPPFVWKAASGGYDGRGVAIIKHAEDLEILPDIPGLIEELINFKTEIAVITARNADGDIKTYPVVEMEFHPTANQVEYVYCPSSLDQRLENTALHMAQTIAKDLEHVGLLAVEMFVTENDEILINEMAPRVHNSGHLTIEGNITSQFEQHLRAILGLPLGETDILRPAVMVNLVGAKGFTGPVYYEGIEKVLALPGAYVHLYGKSETKPFRKMGHVTVTSNSIDDAIKQASDIKDLTTVKSLKK